MKPLQVVRGEVSSENKEFFDDPQVKAAFARRGLDVRVDTAAGAQRLPTAGESKYDFVFDGGPPTVQPTAGARRIAASSAPFFTPVAVATFADVAQVLGRAGVAHAHGGWWTLDMKGFLDLVARHVRWNELPGNTAYPAATLIQIASTDDTTSNMAEMYASIAGYVQNQNRVLDTPASVDDVVNRVSPLFLEQSRPHSSTATFFRDYLSKGQGTAPMVMIPEAQFVARAAARDGSIRPNMVLMYPDPDVLSQPTLTPLTTTGASVGNLLSHDPTLQQLAVDHGFRTTSSPEAFTSLVQRDKVAVPLHVRDVIEPPRRDILQALMTRINAALHVTLGPRPGPSASLA